MKKIYLTIGLPGSGKSTWTINKAQNEENTIIVNKDCFRYMFKGKYVYDKKYEKLLEEQTSSVTKINEKKSFKALKNTSFMILVDNEPQEIKLESNKIYSSDVLGDDSEKILLTLEMDKYVEIVKDKKNIQLTKSEDINNG